MGSSQGRRPLACESRAGPRLGSQGSKGPSGSHRAGVGQVSALLLGNTQAVPLSSTSPLRVELLPPPPSGTDRSGVPVPWVRSYLDCQFAACMCSHPAAELPMGLVQQGKLLGWTGVSRAGEPGLHGLLSLPWVCTHTFHKGSTSPLTHHPAEAVEEKSH